MLVSFEPKREVPQRHGDKIDRARTKTSGRGPSVTYLSLPFHGGVTVEHNPTTKALVAATSPQFRINPPD